MTRVWILFLVLALVVPIFGYFWSSVNFPSYRYRLWLNQAETGRSELRKGHQLEAQKAYANALNIAKHYPNAKIEQGMSELGLADVAMSEKRYDVAADYYNSALKKIETTAGKPEKHAALQFKVVDCILGLARAYAGTRNLALADETFKRALSRTEFLPEQVSATKVEVLNEYAAYLKKTKQNELATYMHLQARCEEIDSADTAKESEQWQQMNELSDELLKAAETFTSAHSYDKAKWAYLQADKIYSKLNGKNSGERYIPLSRFAGMLRAARKDAEAFAIYMQIAQILERDAAHFPEQLFNTYLSAGICLTQTNEHARAVRYLDKAIAIAKAPASQGNANKMPVVQFFKGEALKYAGQHTESAIAYALAVEGRRQFPVKDYPDLADMYFHFGDLRLIAKQFAEAEKLFTLSLAAHHADPNRNEQVSMIKYELAQSLEFQGKKAQAAAVYREVIEGCTNGKLFNRDNSLEKSKKALKALESHGR